MNYRKELREILLRYQEDDANRVEHLHLLLETVAAEEKSKLLKSELGRYQAIVVEMEAILLRLKQL